MNAILKSAGAWAALAALVLLAGCGVRPGKDDPKGKDKGGHVHGKGPHGGVVGDWGGGKLHFEFNVDHAKKEARVYILDTDEKTPVPIKAKDGSLLLSLKGVKSKDTFEVTLKAEPQKNDPKGKASCFIGTHEKLGLEQELEGTLDGEDDGTPYTGTFKEE